MASSTKEKKLIKKQIVAFKSGEGSLESLLKQPVPEPIKKKKNEPINPRGPATGMTKEQLNTFLLAMKSTSSPVFCVMAAMLYSTGGRIAEVCMTLRDNINTEGEMLVITVPPSAQKGKPQFNDKGEVINNPYAKAVTYKLPHSHALAVMLKEGLTDNRNIKENYKKNWSMPEQQFTQKKDENGNLVFHTVQTSDGPRQEAAMMKKPTFIFAGSTKVQQIADAVAKNEPELIKQAAADCHVSAAAFDNAIRNTKKFLRKKDADLVAAKQPEIDAKLDEWLRVTVRHTEEGKKLKLAQITASYRQYDWVEGVSSHSFKRSGVTHLDQAGKSAMGIAEEYSRHRSSGMVQKYLATNGVGPGLPSNKWKKYTIFECKITNF